jgi:hypothetical protein
MLQYLQTLCPETNKQTEPFDVQHSADAAPSYLQFYFTRTARYQDAADESGRLVPLWRAVIHFISLKSKLKMG